MAHCTECLLTLTSRIAMTGVNTVSQPTYDLYFPTAIRSYGDSLIQWFPTEKRPVPPPDRNSPNCPQSNNTTYTTSDGTFSRLFCSVHTIAGI